MNNTLVEDSESETATTSSTASVSSTTDEEEMSPPLANAEAKPSNTLHVDLPRRTAISVQGAWKQYGSGRGKKATPVLQGLNMTVAEGTM